MGTEQRSSTLNVCLRIKPPKQGAEQNIYTVDSERSLRVKTWRGNEIYKFSHIFNQDSSQEDVFHVTAEPAIKSFLEGDDCLLFAYGTTNAGKTFTVQGTPSNPGIVPRAIASIFSSIKDKIDKSPRIAPSNYAGAQLRTQKDKIQIQKMKNVILAGGQMNTQTSAPLVNCSLSFSSAFSSTISTAFDSGADLDSSEADTSMVEELGWKNATRCSLWISMVEVYNENIIDLLVPVKTQAKVSVTPDPEGRFYLQGQSEINVSSIEEAKAVIQYGNKQRKNSSTLLNIQSSRSHCILQVRLLRADRVMPDMMQLGPQSPAAMDIEDFKVSTFMFCDLAGSERVNKAGNKGKQAKETCNINTSLVVLGRCLETLRLKGGTMQHARNAIVPYRDSKLTMILQPLLCEPGPKSLLVNINTSSNLLDETLNVLKFSSVARVMVVKESSKPISHYPMPTHAKQLMELKAAMELEISVATSGRTSEEPDQEMEVEDEEKAEVDKKLCHLCAHVETEERAIQTNVITDTTDSQEMVDLKAKLLMYEQREEETAREHQAKICQIRQELFESFEKLETEMVKNHRDQLDSKETQLYNLMAERLEIQEAYYKELMKEDKSIAESKKMTDDEENKKAEQVANETFKEIQTLQENLELQKKELSDMRRESEKEFSELLYAYGEKDKEVDELKNLLDIAMKEKTNAIAAELDAAQKLQTLNLEMEVRNDMLNTSTTTCQEFEKQLCQLTLDQSDSLLKIKELETEMIVIKEALARNADMMDKLRSENEHLEQDKITMATQVTRLEKQIEDLNEENSDLQKDVKGVKEQLKNTLAEVQFYKEKAEKILKDEENDLSKKLQSVMEKCDYYKQCIQYLLDKYRSDYRRSVAGCANEEATWAALEKEVEGIPSRCAELEIENHELKKQLTVKDEDFEKLVVRRDAILSQYEKELQTKSQELDICKRETQALNKQLLGMTPRKQNSTPQKQPEFKTPLKASVNHKMPSASKSSSKSWLTVRSEFDDSDDSDFDADIRLTRSSSKRAKRVDSPSVQQDGSETVGKSSCRRRNAQPKPSPAKENMEPPAPPFPKSDKPKSKARTRRKLCSNSLHPALDQDETPEDVEMPTTDSLQETRRRLRSTYKY